MYMKLPFEPERDRQARTLDLDGENSIIRLMFITYFLHIHHISDHYFFIDVFFVSKGFAYYSRFHQTDTKSGLFRSRRSCEEFGEMVSP